MLNAVTIDQVNALVDTTNSRWTLYWIAAPVLLVLTAIAMVVAFRKINRQVSRSNEISGPSWLVVSGFMMIPLVGVALTVAGIIYAAVRDASIADEQRATAIELLEADLGKPIQAGGIVPLRPGSDTQALIGTGDDLTYSTIYLALDGKYLVSEIAALGSQE